MKTKYILVIGDNHCGKSSLLWHYVVGYFPPIPKKRQKRERHLKFFRDDGKTTKVVFQVIRNIERDEQSKFNLYPKADAVIFCYSIDSTDSLQSICGKWSTEVRLHCKRNTPTMLLGLKADLRDDRMVAARLRFWLKNFVSTSEALKVAQQLGVMAFFEVSSKFNYCVVEPLNYLIRFLIKRKSIKLHFQSCFS